MWKEDSPWRVCRAVSCCLVWVTLGLGEESMGGHEMKRERVLEDELDSGWRYGCLVWDGKGTLTSCPDGTEQTWEFLPEF